MKDVVRTLPYGNLKIVTVTGAAVDTTIELRPTDGFQYYIIECWGYHDDGTNRSLNWSYYDGTDEITKEGSGAIAALTPWQLNQRSTATPWSTLMAGLIVDYDIYPRLTADALAAGKKLYIKALVYELGDT